MKKQIKNKIKNIFNKAKKYGNAINKVSSRMAQSSCNISDVKLAHPLTPEQMNRFGVKYQDIINKQKVPLSDEDIIYMIEDLYHRIERLENRKNR